MDLNLLYSQHQLAIMQAGSTSSRLLRTRYLATAGALANRIQIYQAAQGAAAAPGWLRAIECAGPRADIRLGIST